MECVFPAFFAEFLQRQLLRRIGFIPLRHVAKRITYRTL